MITETEITNRITRRDRFQIESVVFLPLLNCNADVLIDLDDGLETISETQLQRLNRLLAVPAQRLHEIKVQLYEHWGQYDHFYREDIEFHYDNAEDSYTAASFSFIALAETVVESPDSGELRFSVDWDPEHGAGVVFHRDSFSWCP